MKYNKCKRCGELFFEPQKCPNCGMERKSIAWIYLILIPFFALIGYAIFSFNQSKDGEELLSHFKITSFEPEQSNKVAIYNITIIKKPKSESELKAALRLFTKSKCGYNCAVRFNYEQKRGIYFHHSDDLRLFN